MLYYKISVFGFRFPVSSQCSPFHFPHSSFSVFFNPQSLILHSRFFDPVLFFVPCSLFFSLFMIQHWFKPYQNTDETVYIRDETIDSSFFLNNYSCYVEFFVFPKDSSGQVNVVLCKPFSLLVLNFSTIELLCH